MDRGTHDSDVDFEVRKIGVEVDEYGNLNVGLADNEEGDGLSLIF